MLFSLAHENRTTQYREHLRETVLSALTVV